MRIKVLTLFLSLLALTGCLRKEYAEADEVLAVGDIETLAVEAEVLGEDNVFADVVETPLNVSANRSWSAIIEYEGEESDWLSLSEDELLNLHDFTQVEPVTVMAARNKTMQSRTARLIISEDAEHILILPVVQAGQTRFLRAEPNREKALAILDTIKVAVACNTTWTAEIDPSSTAVVTLMGPEDEESAATAAGEDYGILKVCFDENASAEHEMDAVIKLSAEGCDPCELHLAQAKGEPYVAFKTDDGSVIPTTAETYEIHYASNCHWYMSVDGNENFPGCVLSESDGEASSYGTVVLSYDFGKDPGVHKSVRLKMWADGVDPVYITLSQYGCLHLDLMDLADETTLYRWHNEPNYGIDRAFDNNLHTNWWYNPDYDYEAGTSIGPKWPFSSPVWSGFPTGSAASLKDNVYDFVTHEGYVFKMKSAGSTGIWFHWHQQGFLVGATKNDTWVQFPVIEGLALTTVVYEPSYNSGAATANMRDENGNVIMCDQTINYLGTITENKNQNFWKSEKCTGGNKPDREHSYTCTFKLLETQPGAIVRHTLVYNGSLSIKEYTLIYE